MNTTGVRARRSVRASALVAGLSSAVLMMALVGCSSSSKSAAPKTTTTVLPTTTTGALPGTSIAPPTTATSTSSACQPSTLVVTFAAWNGAGGTGFYSFKVVNHGTPCQIGGWFGAAVYSPSGQELSGTATREMNPSNGKPAEPLLLASGATASFGLTVTENSPTPCPSIGAFHVTPPNAYSSIGVAIPSTHQGGFCRDLGVEPTEPGPTTVPSASRPTSTVLSVFEDRAPSLS